MDIYLCRHGETEWSVSGRHTGKTDLSLTERGKEQAALLRKRLEGMEFDRVFTSPLKRARETCEGMDVVVEPLAVEWDYGDYEGLTTDQIHQANPHWNLFVDGVPNGESPAQVAQRADELLEKMPLYSNRVAIISHGHFLRIFAARYLGLPPQDGRLWILREASVSLLSEEREQPVIAFWNDTHHYG